MSDDIFAEGLAKFKHKENPEVILLVADDADLIRIIVAWPNTAVRKSRRPTRLRSDCEHEIWEWLWKNTKFSRAELLWKSGISEHGFGRKLETLIGNRVLYPDGTVNSFVHRYLRERVLELFDTQPKRRAKKRSAVRAT